MQDTVNVSQEDIERGESHDYGHCPTARLFKRFGWRVRLLPAFTGLWNEGARRSTEIRLRLAWMIQSHARRDLHSGGFWLMQFERCLAERSIRSLSAS
jgi:hypothetical protein